MNRESGKSEFGRLLIGAWFCLTVCTACSFGYDKSSTTDNGTTIWSETNGGSDDGSDDGSDNGSDNGSDDGSDDGSDNESTIGYNAVRPNVMLLVDRSGSMAEPADCGQDDCPSKWEQLLSLSYYLAEAKQVANLGLAVFPSPGSNGCNVSSSVLVPLSGAADVDEQMMAAIAQVVPGGRTPVAAALDEMRLHGRLDARDRDNTVVVLTDGRPNCSCQDNEYICEQNEAVAAVERLENSDPSIDVDIIGFGASAYSAHETLTAMAQAAGDDRYYQSDTIEDLIGTLAQIAVEKAPCTFYLDEWPEPDQLIAWMDDVQVPPCTQESCDSGYTYDPSAGVVDFHGETCAALRDGEQHHVWFDAI